MQANEVKKERKPMTPEQLEALKARLMKAREAKIERDKKRYEYNKEEVKIEMVKKRALTKVKKLVDAGTLKEEELQKVLPVKQEVKNEMPIPVEIPFEEPLPSKPVNIPKPKIVPDVIPFEEQSKSNLDSKIKDASFIDPLPKPKKNKDKDRFLKIVYYKEPSKAALKKLQKIQDSSSEDESSDDESDQSSKVINKPSDDHLYYQSLARQFFS
jgi:hypothetical protein